jgi:hypothetical protein
VVLGVIEPSSIIVVFLAQLVQWLSLTHSLTDTVALKRRGRKLRPKGQEMEAKWRRRYLLPHLINAGIKSRIPSVTYRPFWPHRRVFIGALSISLSTSDLVDGLADDLVDDLADVLADDLVDDHDAQKSKRRSLPTVILVME